MYQKIQKFMYGRYGGDQFNLFLLIAGLVFTILARILFRPIYILTIAVYVFALFRTFSRNSASRQKENTAYLDLTKPIREWFSLQKKKITDRGTYKYFKCPNCRLNLRAPTHRGKIKITCQRCHKDFDAKT